MEKEEFFVKSLIPAGQLVEVVCHLAELVQPTYPRSSRQAIRQALREPLNLAAVYALSCTYRERDHLEVVLAELSTQLVRACQPMKAVPGSASHQRVLRACLTKSREPGLTQAERKRYAAHLELWANARLQNLTAPLYRAVRYTPANREAWMQRYAKGSALPKPSKWQTLARNLEWGLAASLLGFKGDAPSSQLYYGSRVGQSTAQETLKALVSASPVALEQSTSHIEGEPQAASPQERLPSYVKVTTEPGGLLLVTGTYEPAHMLSAELRKEAHALGLLAEKNAAKTGAGVSPVKKQSATSKAPATQATDASDAKRPAFPNLHPDRLVLCVPWTELGAALMQCRDWLEAKPNKDELAQSFQKALDAKLLEDVKLKLKRTFSAKEVEALKLMLNENGNA